jgi:beta-N-acetylhexosaminidase
MRGIADHYALKETLVKGINAGVDLFLICKDTDKANEAISLMRTLVESGEVSEARVLESIARIKKFKQKYVGAVAVPNLDYARNMIRSAPHMQLMNA